MSTMPAQIVLALVQMRRNLRGTIKTGERALLAIDTILEALRPSRAALRGREMCDVRRKRDLREIRATIRYSAS
jgi:hypothetical protein